jgi:GH25 family lysozyme M1 (1,4-beta-N-acetylmuramidase)
MALLVDLYGQYNTVTDWAALAKAVDGAYLKYSDGGGGARTPADAYVANCRAHGILWGGYHFAEPGDPALQAEVFVGACQRLGGELAPALDLESGGIPDAARPWFANTFLQRVHRNFPVVVLYASTSWLATLKPENWGYRWLRIWAAEYGTNTGTRQDIRHYTGQVDLHQYTSFGQIPGVTGHVDLDHTDNLPALRLAATTTPLRHDEETTMQLPAGDHRSASFDIPSGATKIRINCPIESLIVHGIWQAGDALPAGTNFDYKWSHEADFRVDRLRPWRIDVVAGATQGSIIWSYAAGHPERSGSLSFR